MPKKITGQTKLDSAIEAALDVLTGFVFSLLTWMYIVAPLFSIPVVVSQSLAITMVFTVVSLARRFITRRMGNWAHVKGYSFHKVLDYFRGKYGPQVRKGNTKNRSRKASRKQASNGFSASGNDRGTGSSAKLRGKEVR